MNPDFHAAVDGACQDAGKGPGWNNRFRQACKNRGIVLTSDLSDTTTEPLSNWIQAPSPMEEDREGWPVPSYLIWKPDGR